MKGGVTPLLTAPEIRAQVEKLDPANARGLFADEVAARPWIEGRRLQVDTEMQNQHCLTILWQEHGIPVAPMAERTFYRADMSRVGWIALQNATGTGEVELVACLDRGLIHRSMLRYLATWVFEDLKARRLVLRIPESGTAAQGYARRCGFRFEGRAAEYFRNGQDASVWVMLARDCRWLPRKRMQ